MIEFGQNDISSLKTGQELNEAHRCCSSSLKPTQQTKVQIDAWARHATASNGFADAGTDPRNALARLRAGKRDTTWIATETIAETRMKNPALAYSDNGTGEPVLLIHCSSASSTEWDSLCDTLDEDFRVIAPDQWGCGESDPWTGQGEFNLAREAAPILDITGRIGTAVHLVGHSYGGGVALRLARERPDLIRSLTLIEPSVFHLLREGGLENQTLFREILSVAEMVREAALSGDYWGGMARFIDYWNGKGAWSAMPQKVRMKLGKNLSKIVLDFHALFNEPARLEDYAALSIPTLLLCGDRSPAPSCRIVEMLASTMPDARVVRIRDAGHMSPLTHSNAVNAAIGAHLRQHRVAVTRWAA